jgi:hypothetical protein
LDVRRSLFFEGGSSNSAKVNSSVLFIPVDYLYDFFAILYQLAIWMLFGWHCMLE